jgi:hypothetical protein
MTPEREWVIAVLTEHLHRSELDRTFGPLPEATDEESSKAWLERYGQEVDLIEEVLRLGDDSEEGVYNYLVELVGFLGTAIEMWALHTDAPSPAELVQAIAQHDL